MQVGFTRCEVCIFCWGEDADADISAGRFEGKRVEETIIVHEKVDMYPEWVGEDDFGEFMAVGGGSWW